MKNKIKMDKLILLLLVTSCAAHPCQYPPVPLNGNRTCYEDSEGIVTCTFSCKAGYDFAYIRLKNTSASSTMYGSLQANFRYLTAQLSNGMIQPAAFTFAGMVACQQKPEIRRLEKDFELMVTKRVNELCDEGVNCAIRDLETSCHQVDERDVKIILGRKKRSRIARSVDEDQVVKESIELDENAIVTFSYLLAGSVKPSEQLDQEEKLAKQQKLMTAMDNIMSTLKKDGKRGDFNLKVNGKKLALADMSFDDTPIFTCDPGRILVDRSCAKCPVGTFFNVVMLVCESCTIGTFQPLSGQQSCLFCPTNSSTPDLHATTEDECKLLCLPGTFSGNGLELCETCRKGYYQDQYGQTSCNKCPKRFTTLRRGCMELDDCKEKCEPGYVSKTGLQPCWPCPRGTYQEKAGQSSCISCPAKADTATQASTNINITQCELELSDSPQNSAPFNPFGGHEEDELLADECMGTPCLNGGTCVSELFGFDCNCADGYSGTFCEDEINECSVNPCLNEGTCVDRKADYSCLCPNGYTGKKCEVNINDCVGNPCLNGATCVDEVAGFSCSCPNGFQGSNCEIDINECRANPCLNGGTCADEVAAYKCTCPDGSTGNDCEINEDNCASGPCKNQASCVDEVGTFTCQCMPGFTGPMCEIDIDECISNPCSASATCEDLQGGYTCHCPSGFTGDDCSQGVHADVIVEVSTTENITPESLYNLITKAVKACVYGLMFHVAHQIKRTYEVNKAPTVQELGGAKEKQITS